MTDEGINMTGNESQRKTNEEENFIEDPEQMPRDGLTTKHIAAYSVGHFNNDLCAAMWFVYLSWYIKDVVGLDDHITGLCLLSGQIADGLTTPVVGVLSDSCKTRWGKRKPWYVMGFLFVIPCFMGIFAYPEFVNEVDENGEIKNETFQHIWYITLPALFNVGWASVQIAHMSIVNALSLSNRKRDRLSNNRNGFTFAANIVVLGFALLMFSFIDVKKDQFRYLCFICLGLGACSSLFFIFTIGEIYLGKRALSADMKYKKATLPTEQFNKYLLEQEEKSSGLGNKKGKDWKAWLKEGSFYVHGVVYMVVRIAINVTMTMQPFYLNTVTKFVATKEQPTPIELALVPLLSYITSLIFSLYIQQPMTRYLRNRMYPMLVSIVVIALTSIPLFFLNEDRQNFVYPLAAIQGVGLAIMLNTATSLISDVIGSDSESSAFVYGCYSLFDKFANGIILFWMVAAYTEDEQALKIIMSSVPILTAVLAYVFTYCGQKYYSHKMAKITGVRQ